MSMEFKCTHRDLQGRDTTVVTYTVLETGDIYDVMQEFKYFLLATGFQPETVNKVIPEE